MWLKQLRLLLWKNWKLQSRKPIVTLFEIILPALFCLVLLLLRDLATSTVISSPTTFPAYDALELWPGLRVAASMGMAGQLNATARSELRLLNFAYSPDTELTGRIVQKVCLNIMPRNLSWACNNNRQHQGFRNEDELVGTLSSSNGSRNLLDNFACGIVFLNGDYSESLPKDIFYKLRFDGDGTAWQTSFKFPEYFAPGPRMRDWDYGPTPDYYGKGFLAVQHAVDRALIETLRPGLVSSANRSAEDKLLAADYGGLRVLMQRFPYPPYIDDIFVVVVQIQLPFLVMLSLVFISLQIPKELVLEKEQKLKEAMKMMGLKSWVYWWAWMVKYVIFLGLTALMMTCILCPPGIGPENKLRILRYSDVSVVFVYFFLYVMSTICYCFMISSFFNKANAAAAAGGIIFFMSYMPYLFIYTSYHLMRKGSKLAACLLANNAMALGAYVMGKFEGTGEGSQWSNIHRPVSVDDDFSLLDAFMMLIGDSALYLVVMWYVENVFPGTYGVPQPWYFFVQPKYWCGYGRNDVQHAKSVQNGASAVTSSNFEPEPVRVKAGVRIQGLTKLFKTKAGKKAAVNQMNLNFYEGQITALLGHNGAGKTTTMFMLTGFLPPTSGTAVVNGFDIRDDIGSVRSSLGLCPQHDILCTNLTVEEHLYFFAELKNCAKKHLRKEVDYYIKTLGLEEKRSAYAQTLSGGQKRRLSVGIALIGNSKVVILDEPTSGMDPSGRRHMWDVLQKQRRGRTIILSTHFMDEADCLGDRVAIMAEGVVQCCGSPLFLKTRYGEGYKVTMVKKDKCSEEDVASIIRKHVPEAKLQSCVGSELAYVLPAELSAKFPRLFSELEEMKDELGLSGYGASVTSLEEVFIKVGESSSSLVSTENGRAGKENGDAPSSQAITARHIDSLLGRNLARNRGERLLRQQFYAMLTKRVLHTWRNRVLTFSQLLLPTLFTVLTAAIMKNIPSKTVLPPINLTLDTYGPTTVYYDTLADDGLMKSLSMQYESQFRGGLQTAKLVKDASDAIIAAGVESISSYTFQHIVASSFAEQNVSAETAAVTALFNAQPFHAAAVSLSHVGNAMLRHFAAANRTIVTANHPLPQTAMARAEEALSQFNSQSFAYSSDLSFGMSFLAASFVVFLIKERSTKVKHSQFVSGVKWYNFWLATFLWDLVNYSVPSLLLLAVMQIFDVQELAYERLGYLSLLLAAYGLALLPNMYLIQYLFKGPATGYVIVTFYNIVTGITPSLVVTILNLVDEKPLADVLRWVFHALFPNYNLAEGVTSMFENHQYTDLCTRVIPAAYNNASLDSICFSLSVVNATLPCCKDRPSVCGRRGCLGFQENYLSWEPLGIGRVLVFMIGQCALAWTAICLIETGTIQSLLYRCRRVKIVFPEHTPDEPTAEDDDVTRERVRVKRGGPRSASPVIISGLSKYFTRRPAVNNIYVAIPRGECFGLLGVNGAGKTTTFRMLTGDETLSAGDAIMNGYSVRTDISSVHSSIGYCPQFDALIDQMTGEETLYMYGRLRGISEKCLPEVVTDLLEIFTLTPHAKKQTSTYSGGNKRKLSSAIAFVGNPPVVFLDEPTTGMDPVVRRALWNVLAQARDAGTTLVLTSHSMEECEALCTRMAIMVNGQFRCIGGAQHLKNKFGRGYTVMARIQHPADGSVPDAGPLCRYIELRFPGSVQKDVHQNTVHYYVPARPGTSWSKLFSSLEEAKASLGIEDYSVSQTTLEQVFIDFARTQIDPEENGSNASCGCLSSVSCWPTEIVVGESVLDMLGLNQNDYAGGDSGQRDFNLKAL